MSPQHSRLAEDGDGGQQQRQEPAPPPAAAPAASSTSPPRAEENGEPLPQVAVLPSGEMVYLSKDNPYARTYAEHVGQGEFGTNGQPHDDPYAVPVPPALLASYQQPLILERMGRIVRLLAMFDLVWRVAACMAGNRAVTMACYPVYQPRGRSPTHFTAINLPMCCGLPAHTSPHCACFPRRFSRL